MAVARTYTRRSPEAARELILAAAARVFARSLPDAVGVRDIAHEAGISHGLVTHYFGTYEQLVDAVIEQRLAALRAVAFARLGTATFMPTESPLLDVLLELLDDRALARLLAWAMLSGHADRVIGKTAMLRTVIDAMHARLEHVGAAIPRARIEMSVVMAISMVAGWALAGPALTQAAGRAAPYTRDELRGELNRMIRAYVQAP